MKGCKYYDLYKYYPPLCLVESDADDFLNSIGVKLYNDSVAIGEHVFDGVEAEAILAENGIYLYEDGIVLEGKQADEYRIRKAKESEKTRKDENERFEKRYGGNGSKSIGIQNKRISQNIRDGKPYGNRASAKDIENFRKESERAERVMDKHLDGMQKRFPSLTNPADYDRSYKSPERRKALRAADAILRHGRRHPDQYKEAGIFESVEII